LVFGGITDETLAVGKRNIRWGGAVPLVVCNDLHGVVLPGTDAGIRGAKIDTDGYFISGHDWI